MDNPVTDKHSWPDSNNHPFGKRHPRQQNSDELLSTLMSEVTEQRYEEGFFFAADNLARDLLIKDELQERDRDREFFGVSLAMMFCYRQYLEVALKKLIRLLPNAAQEPVPKLNTHSLKRLWNIFGERWSNTFEGDNAKTAEKADAERAVEDFISEWNRIDPNGQTFRYPSDNRGNPNIDGIPIVDLPKLMKQMRGIHAFLCTIPDQIDQRLGAGFG